MVNESQASHPLPLQYQTTPLGHGVLTLFNRTRYGKFPETEAGNQTNWITEPLSTWLQFYLQISMCLSVATQILWDQSAR